MPEFKPLTLEDKALFDEYTGEYPFKTYEFAFATLYLWREFSRVEYAIIDGALVIRKTEKKHGCYFMPPIGYTRETLAPLGDELQRLRVLHCDTKYLFRDVEESFLEDLKAVYGDRVMALEDVDNFDYIYRSEDLINLAGRHYDAKRNHYGHFVSSYAHEVRDISTQAVRDDCREFARAWFEKNGGESEMLRAELSGIGDLLTQAEVLGIKGIAVYVDGKIAGFTLGEQVNSEMGVIHIEKADSQFRGVYAFINRVFAEMYFSGVRYINREEDLGVEGLRRAKQSYQPVRLEKKYLVNLS